MIITLSPAKLMDFKPVEISTESTTPLFEKEANELMAILKGYSVEEIGDLMSINPKMAFTAYQQLQAFDHEKTPLKQAAFAYNGIAYTGLDIKSFTPLETEYAQRHLIMLSGLYGALRPLDIIKPYRVEMQIKIMNSKGQDLYSFWKDTLTKYLTKRLNADDGIWVNLMSNEYTKVIDNKKLGKGIRIITPNFKEQTPTGYRQVVVHTKKARGMMARFILKNKIVEIEHLKGFDEEGYFFSPQLSTEKEWVFVR